ncbi:MAG: peptidylprolyl isomerase [Saprospiraceae bacterium]|nr:peptidylprolyl isomerase [Saprospiraceae bacterium]
MRKGFNNIPVFIRFLAATVLLSSCGRPIADFAFVYEKDEKAPAAVRFENKSQKAEAYQWNFGDGKSSADSLPMHEYKHSGAYIVQLTASKGKKSRTVTKELIVKPPDKCLVEIETKFGTMLFELFDATPQHRDNFIKLAEEGFYDSLLFHRVINNFMIQGGDPNSKKAKPGQALGMGGPGYTVPAEFVDTLVHVKGALAAARQGDQVNPQKRSSGSQFYIVQGQVTTRATLDQIEARKGFRYGQAQREAYAALGGTPFLDRDYTVFGRIIKGMEVIDEIAKVQTAPGDRPVEDVIMTIRVIK